MTTTVRDVNRASERGIKRGNRTRILYADCSHKSMHLLCRL